MPKTKALWDGKNLPQVPPEFSTGRHGDVCHGLWHVRQYLAWRRAWDTLLMDDVVYHGGDLYTVPSKSEPDKWYVVHHLRLAPDGYLWLCDCPASEKGGTVCAHAMAAYLYRLQMHLRWRLKAPPARQERTEHVGATVAPAPAV